MIKIGLWVSNSTYLLICNNIKIEFLNVKKSPELIKETSLLILDETFSEEGGLNYLNSINKAVVLMGNSTTSTARMLLKNKSLFDMISKRDFIMLEKVIDDFFKESVEYLRIENSSSLSLIKKEDIAYISYDRLLRRSIITLFNKEEYFSKVSLGELENILSLNFIRVERGYIINKSKVKSLDFKEEVLVFYDNMTLPLGKRTLKKMESLVFTETFSLNI